MKPLAQALAQSMPRRAAYAVYAHTRHADGTTGLVEVRCLTPLRADLVQQRPPSLITADRWRYELLTNGTPQMVGSFREVVAWTRALGDLDWQPLYLDEPLLASVDEPEDEASEAQDTPNDAQVEG